MQGCVGYQATSGRSIWHMLLLPCSAAVTAVLAKIAPQLAARFLAACDLQQAEYVLVKVTDNLISFPCTCAAHPSATTSSKLGSTFCLAAEIWISIVIVTSIWRIELKPNQQEISMSRHQALLCCVDLCFVHTAHRWAAPSAWSHRVFPKS